MFSDGRRIERGRPPPARPGQGNAEETSLVLPRVRWLAATGLVLTALMQGIFLLTGTARGPLYLALQGVGLVGSLAAAWGLLRGPRALVAAGLGANAVTRALHVVLGLTRLPLWLNALLFVGYLGGALGAGLSRPRLLRLGLWLAFIGYAVSAMSALSGGRLEALVALTLGAVGMSLAAPNAEDVSASPGTPEGRSG